MDNLVLIRVAATLQRTLQGAILDEMREDAPFRLRLHLRQDDRPRTVLISVDPDQPWVGRPVSRGKKSVAPIGAFTALCMRSLRGRPLVAIDKPPLDRQIVLRFAGGRALVAELTAPGANLVLLDNEGKVIQAARRPGRSGKRLASGEIYLPRPLPPGSFDPFAADPQAIDARLRDEGEDGAPDKRLARVCFGIGTAAAELVLAESLQGGESVGVVLARRLADLIGGKIDPVIEACSTPGTAESCGFDPADARLFPWRPERPPVLNRVFLTHEDAAATAGLFHETVGRFLGECHRGRALLDLLRREVRRIRHAERRVTVDRERFADPDRYRRWGEALLAGLQQARRVGEHWLVPDPYDAEGPHLVIPADPTRSPQQEAEACFDLQRKARRGLVSADDRSRQLAVRRAELERLAVAHAGLSDRGGPVETLEREMQRVGIPVGLTPATRGPAAVPAGRRPRVEGLRLFRTGDGSTVMIGKSGRENQRLTFKIAGPEDFWLHALGVSGAHVVLRNEERSPRPSPEALEEAAAAAAWFSNASREGWVEVQWTRRKYVRQLRGGSPGTVRIKKSETVRVRPRRPEALAGRD